MSIFKQSFPKWVKNQLNLRQDLQSTGINGGYKSNEALVWEQSKQCVVRASSLVDYAASVDLSLGDNNNVVEFDNLKGSQLAKRFILQGGILNGNQHRSANFGEAGSAYGDPLLGSNGGSDGFGQVPMPGITSLDISTKSAYGSLRQAKLSFVVHNLRQLEVMELLYLRPGYPVLVEWQWTPFVRSTNEIDTLEYRVSDSILFPNGGGKVRQEDVYKTIVNLKKTTEGNYDGFLGFVTNFGFQARADGGFDCYTELISMGEVLDSLKIPTSGKILQQLTGRNFSFALNREDQEEKEEINNPDILRAILLAMAKFTGTIDTAGGELSWTPQFIENWINNESSDLAEAIVGLIYDRFPPLTKEGLTTNEKSAKLDQYILKKNYIVGAEGEDTFDAPLNTGYIRWDLLVFLINEFVITDPGANTLQRSNPPVKITTQILRNNPNNNDNPEPEILKYAKFRGGDNEFVDLSCDPGICILPHSFFDPNLAKTIDPNQNIVGKLAEGIGDFFEWGWNRLSNATVALFDEDVEAIGFFTDSTLNEDTAKRNIGGIFLNTEMLLEAYDSSIRGKKDASLGDFLKAVWEDRVNEACPLHNFIFQISPEMPNECYIIDLPADGNDLNEIAKEIFTVEVQSNKSVVRDYQLEASIPDALKSTIAVHAQDPTSVEDLDDVTFRAFNRAISNRIFIPPPEPKTQAELDKEAQDEADKRDVYENSKEAEVDRRLGITYEESQTPLGKITKRYKLALENFEKQSALYFEIINADENGSVDDSQDKVDDLKSTLKELQTTALQLDEFENKMLSTSAVIPLEFNMTFDGISNIIIGCLFKIREDRLPKGYRQGTDGGANVAFIVFNEEQSITAGQDWTTKIGGKMILLPNENLGKKTSGGSRASSNSGKILTEEPN